MEKERKNRTLPDGWCFMSYCLIRVRDLDTYLYESNTKNNPLGLPLDGEPGRY
jgi:hypothetical protein